MAIIAAIGLIGAPALMLAGLFFAIRGEWWGVAACGAPIGVGLCALGWLMYIWRLDVSD